jgi:hypothetical protein
MHRSQFNFRSFSHIKKRSKKNPLTLKPHAAKPPPDRSQFHLSLTAQRLYAPAMNNDIKDPTSVAFHHVREPRQLLLLTRSFKLEMQTATIPPSESLRILCLDGGGIKGYTTLLILKRILRTMLDEGSLTEIPRPCNFFDLIIGTSTGGLIAVMLGRLHMTIDECIAKYEQVGREVFGKKPPGGQFGKIFKGLKSSSFYDIRILQDEVRKALDSKGISRDTSFLEGNAPMCKVYVHHNG